MVKQICSYAGFATDSKVGKVYRIAPNGPMRPLAAPDFVGYGKVLSSDCDGHFTLEVIPDDHPDVTKDWLGVHASMLEMRPPSEQKERVWEPAMTVAALIDALKQLDPEQKVYVADNDESVNLPLVEVNASNPRGIVLENGGYRHPDEWHDD